MGKNKAGIEESSNKTEDCKDEIEKYNRIIEERIDEKEKQNKLEKYLDELGDEYKILLYRALKSRSNPLDDLSVSELLRLDNEIKRPLLEDYKKRNKYVRIFLLTGYMYMFVGILSIGVILYLGIDYEYRRTYILMSSLITVIGLFMALYAITYRIIGINHISSKSVYGAQKNQLEYEVVSMWRELEAVVKDLSIDAGTNTPRSTLDYLYEKKYIDDEEYVILKDLLKTRNSIVYKDGTNYSKDGLRKLLYKAYTIIARLNNAI